MFRCAFGYDFCVYGKDKVCYGTCAGPDREPGQSGRPWARNRGRNEERSESAGGASPCPASGWKTQLSGSFAAKLIVWATGNSHHLAGSAAVPEATPASIPRWRVDCKLTWRVSPILISADPEDLKITCTRPNLTFLPAVWN